MLITYERDRLSLYAAYIYPTVLDEGYDHAPVGKGVAREVCVSAVYGMSWFGRRVD